HLVVRGDLRGHLKRQHRFGKGRGGGTAGAGFLVGNLRPSENLGGFLVGGDHLGLGNNLAVAGALHCRQLQVEDGVVGDETDTDTGGGTRYAHVDEGGVERNFRNTDKARGVTRRHKVLVTGRALG